VLFRSQCALLVSVLDAPAWSGRGRHRGVGSSYLARAAPGQQLQVAVKQPNTPFRLPEQSRPLVLIAAGAGLAPFRGFLEERAARKAAGEETGRALLYFGCDHRDVDYLHRDELARWEAAGVVEVRPTFCKAPEGERIFVQHRLWEEREEVRALIQGGAKVLLCGDGARLAPAVREVLSRILPMPGALAALEQSGRFVADVFS
jgi:cytochrome P450/NADPH-cytochrome P450 reductase